MLPSKDIMMKLNIYLNQNQFSYCDFQTMNTHLNILEHPMNTHLNIQPQTLPSL